MNWLLAITVLFVLLIAACGIWMNAASKSVDKTVDFGFRVTCYDAGFYDGTAAARKQPPYSDSRCVELYSNGYGDGPLVEARPRQPRARARMSHPPSASHTRARFGGHNWTLSACQAIRQFGSLSLRVNITKRRHF